MTGNHPKEVHISVLRVSSIIVAPRPPPPPLPAKKVTNKMKTTE